MGKHGFFPLSTESGAPTPGVGEVRPRTPQASAGLSLEESLERCLTELVHYYRHSGAGRLVTGIVHQMNNPLQVLSFLSELLDQKSREEPDLLGGCPKPQAAKLGALLEYRREKIVQFRHEIEKLQALIRRLIRQGVHEEAQDQQHLDLNQIVEEQLDLYLAQPFFKHQVRKKIRLQPGLPPLYGHYLDFSQSFRNVLDNALEAMEGTGRRELTVTTALRDRRRVLSVGDTGPGIPARSRPLLFQPFFTTKRGHAGLGLFLVRRLLAPYGAEIAIDSTQGGTWVRLCLPV